MGDARDEGSEEKFLHRWARRKQADQQGGAIAEPRSVSTAAEPAVSHAEPVVEQEEQQALTDADMPPIDSLTGDSDFSVFMSPKVSEQLRVQALRKLFHLPAFNVTDGLNDYDEDYTRFTGLGNVVTQEMQRTLKRELEAEVVPEAEPVAKTAASVEPADADLIEDMDEDGDAESSQPSRLS